MKLGAVTLELGAGLALRHNYTAGACTCTPMQMYMHVYKLYAALVLL